MEIRKVIIVTSGGQRKQVVETGAETLGQLKADLDVVGIDYEGMTFFEGLSKTELMSDDSLLPRNIVRNGVPTNNLVFMLTVPQKKIKSGTMSRQEAYAKIKELGLQEDCMTKFGKNFTMCKTADLVNLIDEATSPQAPVEQVATCDCMQNAGEAVEPNAVTAIKELLEVLYENDYISLSEKDRVLDSLYTVKVGPDSPYTDNELDDIVRELFN